MYNLLSITLHNKFLPGQVLFFQILWFWFYNRFLNKIHKILIYKIQRGVEIKKRTCKS